MSWKLAIGIWKGTVISRDSHVTKEKYHEGTPLESLEDCQKCLHHWRMNYRSFGYSIQWAKAISPDGQEHRL